MHLVHESIPATQVLADCRIVGRAAVRVGHVQAGDVHEALAQQASTEVSRALTSVREVSLRAASNSCDQPRVRRSLAGDDTILSIGDRIISVQMRGNPGSLIAAVATERTI